MSALPGRVIAQPMGEDIKPLPKGNAHPVKRTSEDRLQQMRDWYQANKARVSKEKRAAYKAMTAEKREARLQRMRETTKRLEAERNARRAKSDDR